MSPNMSLIKNPMPSQDPSVRIHNFDEVALGYTEQMAVSEAMRCLDCKTMPCAQGCPVKIHIPEFIRKIKECDFEAAYQVIAQSSSLPAVCGRVCPQESQCEGKCVRGIKGEPVAIGRLERFVADWHNANATAAPAKPEPNADMTAISKEIDSMMQALQQEIENDPDLASNPVLDALAYKNSTSNVGKDARLADLQNSFDAEMASLENLHEYKLISEEEYLARKKALTEDYAAQERAIQTEGWTGALESAMNVLDGISQAMSAAQEAEYANLDELKAHYQRGGLGDMKVKKFLNAVMQEILEPIRLRREELAKIAKEAGCHDKIWEMLFSDHEAHYSF